MRQLRGYLILSLALATGALSLAAARSAPASVLPVACGAGALVAAIHSANASGAATTLVLAADCTYTLRAVDNHTKGPNGLPAITGAMTIVGNRAVIERSSDPATPPFRPFFVDTTGELTLQDLTIRNGRAGPGSPGLRSADPVLCRGGAGRKGGGIFNQGALTLTNSALRGNSAGTGGPGSTVCDDINCSERAGCDGGIGGAGGGIFSRGVLTVTNSTLADNASGGGGSGASGEESGSAAPGADAGAGGGIFNAGTLWLVNSTLSHNEAGTGGHGGHDGRNGGTGGQGGGMANTGTVSLINSTVHGNVAGSGGYGDCGDGGSMGTGGSGGGIVNRGSLTIRSSTITYNAIGFERPLSDCDRGRPGVGGGIFNDGGAFTLANSIVDGQRTGEDCSGTLPSSRRYSLGGSSCGDDQADPQLLKGAARLAPLGDYGGPTETRALLLGSDAIDRGDPAGCRDAQGHRLSKDQRGFPRRRVARCDIGAIEFHPGEKLPDAIQCGSVLGPHGTFVLDRDLSCPYNADAFSEPALTVVASATLDLNGHTVTCAGSREVGIRIEGSGAAVRNGTVRDCYTGVSIAGSDNLLRRLTLIANEYGLAIERGTANRIKASAARDGNIGFLIVGGSTLTGNTATGNETGFYLIGSGGDPQALHVLIDNEATGNGDGVFSTVAGVRLIQNRILRNGRDGVHLSESHGTLEGNRIANNQRNGIFCADCSSLTVTDNKVVGNGGDGVLVDIHHNSNGPSPALTNNRAMRNKQTGINVVGGAFTAFPATITGNLARGNQVDLADDAPNCAGGVWQGNSFQTASQICIH
jgi:parallel beta-helix repeat protein